MSQYLFWLTMRLALLTAWSMPGSPKLKWAKVEIGCQTFTWKSSVVPK